ncbi:MAG: HU family DNA-binding protein [Alloprevotella sp.]|nr:HU family DNA-binding protein [Alloprevotella sp.]
MSKKTRFFLREMPAAVGTGRRIYPQLIGNGTLQTEDVARELAHRTTLTEADIRATLTGLRELLAERLSEGTRIKLDGIGTFVATLRFSERGMDQLNKGEELTGADVELKSICCRPDVLLLRDVAKAMEPTLVSENVFEESDTSTDADARLAIALSFIRQHGAIYTNEYATLSQQTHSTAWRELQRFVRAGKLKKAGSGSRTAYWVETTAG